ncbi:MAG: hypothetical protein A2519_01880 [Candidatus Raymondbacteria bacterium RIFOXYD12_FULL_49_13]|uniref:Uncharacterized protein n=1 Tax=Candidatus Raymondbacteria bacterium RIFOXYD12_FULL_49_13 TaxID=1817890 RepID=A0A1F7FFY6_UNCRA|nr:MAG: hypothetical protein A2519_01880 [Candidatus Raymondbacteria bacterium RIFOXYD12_FULL_49_13]
MVVAEGDVIVPEYWTTSNTTTLQPVQVISERPFRDSYCIEIGTSTAFVQQHVILDPTYTGTYTLSFRFKGSISVFYGGHSLASLSNETENWILGTAEIDRSASEFAGLDQGLLQFVNADAVSGSKLYVDYIVLKKSAIATNVQVSTSFYDGLNKPLLEQIDDGSESVINVYHQRDAFNRDSLKTLPVKATSQTPNAARQYLYHADYFEENPRKHLYVEMAKDAYSDPASTGLPFSGNPANTNPNNADFRAMLHPFVVTTYHNDPRALVKNVGGPGYVYTHDHPVQKNQAGRATTAEENTFGVADETDGKYILEQTLDEQGRLTNIWKNGKGNVVKTQTPTVGTDLMVSTNEYFLASDLVKKTVSPAGLEDKFYYDARKRLIRKETPDADYVEYRYDNNNNLRATQDGNGRTIGYYVVNKYDGSNRLVSVLQYNTGGTSAYAFGEAPVNSITWPDNLDENAVLLTENRYDRISEANQTPVMLVSVLSGPVLSYEKVHNIAGRLHTTIQYFNHPKAPNVSSALWYIYSYTDEGLVEAVYQYMDNMIPRKTTFAYNTNGSLMKSAYQEADGTLHEVSYEYDNRGLLKSYSSKLGGDYINMLNYAYTVNGQIEKVEFGSKDMAALYKYHIKGMVKDIAYNNTIGTSPAALFKQTLGYDVGNALFPSSPVNNIMPRFDGNVAWQVSNVFAAHSATPNTPYRHGYIYQYDAANRLTTADYYEGAASSETDVLASKQGVNEDRSSGYEYDKNGRITKLTRKTPSEELGSLSTSDKAAHANPASYVYKAGTNLLKSITNFLFPDKQDADNYIYDKNGNMVFDKSKKMVITYDYRNMPTNFLFFDSFKKTGTSSEDLSDYSFDNDILKRVFMIYDPSGNRVGKLEYANEKLDNYSGIRMFDELAICTNDGCVD